MTRKPRPPIGDAPRGLRQRQRLDGSWRIWWEPREADRKLGFAVVDLSHVTHETARREARRLNAELETARKTGRKKGAPRPAGRCISDLVADYKQCPHFRGLAAATQSSYRKLLLQIDDKWGPQLVSAFDKPTMHTWYEALHAAKSPRMAQALIRMMSILFERAEKLGWRPDNSNPCLRLGVATPAPRDRVATWDEIDALEQAAHDAGLASMALAIQLALFAGQRQTDVITAPRAAFRLITLADPAIGGDPRPQWVWHLTRSKNKTAGLLPLHPEIIPALRSALVETGSAAAPRTDATPLLIEERVGRPYDPFLFAKRWDEIRAAAATTLPSCATLQFRDLRRTFGVLARTGGASREDASDVLGNSAAINDRLYETYMPATFATAARAVAAVQRPAKAGAGAGKKEGKA